MLITKRVHFAVGCGLLGALCAFGISRLLISDPSRIAGDRLTYSVCYQPVDSLAPWYAALASYIFVYTCVFLLAFRRFRQDIFRRPRWCLTR